MKKVIRLSESELTRLIKKIIAEQSVTSNNEVPFNIDSCVITVDDSNISDFQRNYMWSKGFNDIKITKLARFLLKNPEDISEEGCEENGFFINSKKYNEGQSYRGIKIKTLGIPRGCSVNVYGDTGTPLLLMVKLVNDGNGSIKGIAVIKGLNVTSDD